MTQVQIIEERWKKFESWSLASGAAFAGFDFLCDGSRRVCGWRNLERSSRMRVPNYLRVLTLME